MRAILDDMLQQFEVLDRFNFQLSDEQVPPLLTSLSVTAVRKLFVGRTSSHES